MFVVGTVQRVVNAADPSKFDLDWPVVFEDDTHGFIGGTVAKRASREAAQALSDALNAALAVDGMGQVR